MDDIREILSYIPPSICTYNEWVQVGMALKNEGYPVDLWEQWSATDTSRFTPGECQKKWNSFRAVDEPVTVGTLVQMAKKYGYSPQYGDDEVLDFDSVISAEGEPKAFIDRSWVEKKEVVIPDNWDPAQQLITYLETLFESDDYVGYVTQSWENKKGKRVPQKGNYDRTAGQLITELSRCGNDVGKVFGDYDIQTGAWIRFNPLDGKGVMNENVTDFRFALVESDDLDLDEQNALIRELELPVAALVYSGGKSLHAIVRVEAADAKEYRKRVEFLYGICQKNGLKIDTQNKNPSRLSRMPGVMRGENKQYLIETNIGKSSWNEWREWVEGINDDLPDIERYADIADDLPELSPELISGVLRQGHKMLLSGPPKAGKSFALIELAVAIASGGTWFGFQCAKGKVLYVNFEIDRASYLHRIDDVCKAMNTPREAFGNIDFWSLRGQSVPMDRLAPKLIRRAHRNNYIAVIIDPIYKVITGDENSAEEMAKFCNQFDKVSHELGCSIIYCHHHSKGSQGWKNAMDRASGSGVFSRDPDALIDMLELAMPEVEIAEDAVIDENQTAWRIEGTLREFPTFQPRNVFFSFPVHYLDEGGILDAAVPKGSRESNVIGHGKAEGTDEERKAERFILLSNAFEAAKDPSSNAATAAQILECIPKNKKGKKPAKNTIYKWLTEFKDDFAPIGKTGYYTRRESSD